MKNIIKVISISILIILFSACENETKKKDKSINEPVVMIKIDTSNNNINYGISISSNNCVKKRNLISFPMSAEKFHLLEIYSEKKHYEIFYEYTSARPVYNRTMYINNKSLSIDSIVSGYFNFEKLDYDFEKTLINKNICDYDFSKFINTSE